MKKTLYIAAIFGLVGSAFNGGVASSRSWNLILINSSDSGLISFSGEEVPAITATEHGNETYVFTFFNDIYNCSITAEAASVDEAGIERQVKSRSGLPVPPPSTQWYLRLLARTCEATYVYKIVDTAFAPDGNPFETSAKLAVLAPPVFFEFAPVGT